jgi:Ni/Co efflux regulator RcnB
VKKIAAFILAVLLTLSAFAPVTAQASTPSEREAHKAQKRQHKSMKKFNKNQQKSQKSAQKQQKKAMKDWKKGHPSQH